MALRVLTEEQLRFFEDNGYVVVPSGIPQENLDATVAAIWDFLGVDPNDSATWYPDDKRWGLVHMHQHPALWANRQFPRLHQLFADILGTENLWVSMDRAAMKPPIDPRFPHYDDKGFVHWDLDTSKPLPTELHVQGVLSLTDTEANMGGFCCIPGFHKNLAQWIAAQPEGRSPHSPDLSRLPEGMKVTPIPMKAGDIVIWNVMLAHGNGRNEGTRPRLAQYITMFRASDHEPAAAERVACWQERRPPAGWDNEVPVRYRGKETTNPPAELTPLGRKLLGADPW